MLDTQSPPPPKKNKKRGGEKRRGGRGDICISSRRRLGDTVRARLPCTVARAPFSGARSCRVPEGCRVDRSPDPSKFVAADGGLRRRIRPAPRSLGARPRPGLLPLRSAGRGGDWRSPFSPHTPGRGLTPSPRLRGTAPDSRFLPAARPALPQGPGRPSPFTCSIAWPGTPLNRIRPLRVPNRTRRLLEPTRSCRDPQVPAPSSPAHWLSASWGLYAPLLLA